MLEFVSFGWSLRSPYSSQSILDGEEKKSVLRTQNLENSCPHVLWKAKIMLLHSHLLQNYLFYK